MLNTWKILTKFTNHKIGKKKKKKEKRKNNGTEVYMCALYRNYQKTCCETKCDLRTNEFKQSYWSKA